MQLIHNENRVIRSLTEAMVKAHAARLGLTIQKIKWLQGADSIKAHDVVITFKEAVGSADRRVQSLLREFSGSVDDRTYRLGYEELKFSNPHNIGDYHVMMANPEVKDNNKMNAAWADIMNPELRDLRGQPSKEGEGIHLSVGLKRSDGTFHSPNLVKGQLLLKCAGYLSDDQIAQLLNYQSELPLIAYDLEEEPPAEIPPVVLDALTQG